MLRSNKQDRTKKDMRGQTTLDFAIGIAIFLGVLIFVFTFVPGILAPFDVAGEEEPAKSDRIADSLSQGMLGSPENPHVLDRYCTVEFFDDGDPDEDCNFEGETLEERFDLSFSQNVNVTVVGNLSEAGGQPEQLCWDGNELKERDECNGGTVLTKGDDVPDWGTVITARRVVSLHGESVTLRVVVW